MIPSKGRRKSDKFEYLALVKQPNDRFVIYFLCLLALSVLFVTIRQPGERKKLTRHCSSGPCNQDSSRHPGTQYWFWHPCS